MLQMRQAVVVDAHRTGGTRLRSADLLLRILRSQRDRHREHLKTLPAGEVAASFMEVSTMARLARLFVALELRMRNAHVSSRRRLTTLR
jgi:hypothetical protein